MTDHELVERVARAICDRNPDARVQFHIQNSFDRTGRREHIAGKPMPAWRLFEARAQAAIAAAEAAGVK